MQQRARVESDRVAGEGSPRPRPEVRPNGNGDLKDKRIAELLRDLSQDTSMLVRQETELFKTEMNARVERVQKLAGVLGIGGAITWFGCMAVTAAIILGLAEVMDGWAAALIVGVVYLIVGGIALLIGRNRLKEQELQPTATRDSVRKDVRTVRDAARGQGHRALPSGTHRGTAQEAAG